MQRPEQNDCIQFGHCVRTEFGVGKTQPDELGRDRADQRIPGICATKSQRHLHGRHQSERGHRLTSAVLVSFFGNFFFGLKIYFFYCIGYVERVRHKFH